MEFPSPVTDITSDPTKNVFLPTNDQSIFLALLVPPHHCAPGRKAVPSP